ncbi:LysR family transcriptional regulator [Isoptericola sp. F-RaC21]|uniref:LysR family transcriptional regulator n=1 Tax=Isoptericola sp. F-RaC21 TaxID=3141452 RepID=UPI00315B840D
MDARQLKYFLAVVDHGGFGRAAEHLHLAQPSLSQAMSGLERELGVPLFHRVGRGVVLSEAGAELVEPARQVLRDLDAARSIVQSVKGVLRGTVDLVTMPSPGIEPLTTIMARFGEVHPGVVLDVDAAFTPDEVVHAVRSGTREIGLLGYAAGLDTTGLVLVPIEEQPLILLSPPDAEGLPDGEVVHHTDLAGRRMVVSQRGSLMRRLVDEILAAGIDARIVAEVAHRTSILPLVLSGFGHAVMPSSWTPLARRAGAVVHQIEPTSALRVAAVVRKASLTPAARAFHRAVTEYAAEAAAS